jgi:hypothetical protein
MTSTASISVPFLVLVDNANNADVNTNELKRLNGSLASAIDSWTQKILENIETREGLINDLQRELNKYVDIAQRSASEVRWEESQYQQNVEQVSYFDDSIRALRQEPPSNFTDADIDQATKQRNRYIDDLERSAKKLEIARHNAFGATLLSSKLQRMLNRNIMNNETDYAAVAEFQNIKEQVVQDRHMINMRSSITLRVRNYAIAISQTDEQTAAALEAKYAAATDQLFKKFGHGNIATSSEDGIPLYVNGVSVSDIDQGQIGDCWYLAVLSSIAARHPEKIQQLITQIAPNTYRVELYDLSGKKVTVVVAPSDVNDPTGGGIAGASMASEKWVRVMEAALIKSRGVIARNGNDSTGNGSIDGGTLDQEQDAYHAITGERGTIYNPPQMTNQAVANVISQNVNMGKPVWASTTELPADVPQPQWYVPGHAFAVLGTDGASVLVRNPWGDAAPGSSQGIIAISLDDFRRYFDHGMGAGA